MSDLKTEMPRRSDDEQSGIKGGGLPGNQAGGDWESETPDLEIIERHLVEIDYPIGKADLVQHIRRQKAPLQVVYLMEKLPDQQYQDARDIHNALARIA